MTASASDVPNEARFMANQYIFWIKLYFSINNLPQCVPNTYAGEHFISLLVSCSVEMVLMSIRSIFEYKINFIFFNIVV